MVACLALVVHVLVALRPDGRLPTDGEARLAAAVFAVRDGRLGAVAGGVPELLAAPQLAAVTALLPAASWGSGESVWGAARSAGLALGVVTAVLLWGVARRLGCGAGSTALAVGVVGVLPVAVQLHASVTAAAVAVPWLLLAALLSWRGRVLGLAAAAAAGIAVLTAPLVAAALLVLAAHGVADRRSGPRWLPRRPLVGGLVAAAVAVAALAAGAGPLAGAAAPAIPTGVAVVGVLCGLVAVAAGWRVRWVRPLLGAPLLVLAVLLVPGPGRAAAAMTALPLLAVVVAAVADDVALRTGARRPGPATGFAGAAVVPAVAALAAVAAVVAAVVAVPGAGGRDGAAAAGAGPGVDPVAAPLLAWAADPATSGAVTSPPAVHADPLDRAELVAAGFPPDRLRGLGEPVGDGDLVLRTARPTADAAVATPCAPGTLRATVPRPLGPSDICGARPVVDVEPAARPSRVRVGTALAGNPGLRLDPAAAELLARGEVDPRVMIVLATLTAGHTLEIADFPRSPLEPPAVLRRNVVVTAVDGAPVATPTPPAWPLRAWLRSQPPPYTPTLLRDDPAGLLVGYPTPAPPGLLPT